MDEEDLQFVVSVTRAEEPACWNVKVGIDVVGQVVGEGGDWTWRRGGLGSEELPDRMTAVLELLQQVQNEFRDAEDDEPLEDEAFTLRYTDPNTGRRVVLYRCQLGCTNCGEVLPGSQVGMRRINDRLYRSQPQCSRCRSKKQG